MPTLHLDLKFLLDERAAALNEARSRTPKFMHWLAEGGDGWRGPIHARMVCKVLALVICVVGQAGHEGYLSYLQGCELKDVADEIRSRIRQGRAEGVPL
jgi:hypothetical protein